MATLTIPQIAQLALNAGIPDGQPLYTCVSIALAESSGRTDAVNQNDDGTKDVGLWQINDVHKLMWTTTGDMRTDPVENARLMVKISGLGMSWGPWTTFNTGAYSNHMQQVMSEVQTAQLTRGTQVNITNPEDTLGGGYGTAPSIQQAGLEDIPGLGELKESYDTINAFFTFITDPDGWMRILKCGIGLIMVITGVVLMMRSEIEQVVELGAKLL